MGRLNELEEIIKKMKERLPDVITLDLPKEKYEDIIDQANLGILRLTSRWCDICNDLQKGSTFHDVSTGKHLCFQHIVHEWTARDLMKALKHEK